MRAKEDTHICFVRLCPPACLLATKFCTNSGRVILSDRQTLGMLA